jgi:hypothetical protein
MGMVFGDGVVDLGCASVRANRPTWRDRPRRLARSIIDVDQSAAGMRRIIPISDRLTQGMAVRLTFSLAKTYGALAFGGMLSSVSEWCRPKARAEADDKRRQVVQVR